MDFKDPMTSLGVGAGVMGVGSLVSGIAGYYSAKKAREAQRKALEEGRGYVTDAYNKGVDYQKPYSKNSESDYNRFRNDIQGGQYDIQSEEYNDKPFQYDQYSDPSTQFRMQQGTNAINTNAAARGSGLSGATLKALAKYGSDLGSQEYGNAYNRYNQDRGFGYNKFQDSYNRRAAETGNRYNRALGIVNTGLNATNNLSNLASNYGSQMSNLSMQGGNSQAAGIMAQGQAIGNFGQNIQSIAPYIMAPYTSQFENDGSQGYTPRQQQARSAPNYNNIMRGANATGRLY